MTSADLKFPLTAGKFERSGGFPMRWLRKGCLPNRSKSSETNATGDAKHKCRRPGAIPREAHLCPRDPAKAKRNPC